MSVERSRHADRAGCVVAAIGEQRFVKRIIRMSAIYFEIGSKPATC
jgi:hypothetical protein